MRITSFWAKGYRSLKDVRIDDLGPFNVFYGKNGSGKSNILEAIRTLFALAPLAMGNAVREGNFPPSEVIARRDFCAQSTSPIVTLGAQLMSSEGASELTIGETSLRELTIELTLDWIVEQAPVLRLSRLQAEDKDFLAQPPRPVPAKSPFVRAIETASDPARREIVAIVSELVAKRLFALVKSDREPKREGMASTSTVEDHLRDGRIKNALLAAQNSPDHVIRRRLSKLRQLLAGPPLCRPEFAPVHDPVRNEVDLREVLPEPNPEGKDVSIDLAGLGVAQIYSILAQAMLRGAYVVGIEEPEAHLHAPTSGKDLRHLLKRLVDERHIDQLFIATHSNLFDLDPTGYFDVSLKDGCTVVERADLTRIDRDHLYEPGPAKHALMRMLEYMPKDEIVFRRGDGSPISIDEMLQHLRDDTDLAVEFLEDMHSVTLRLLKAKTKQPKGS